VVGSASGRQLTLPRPLGSRPPLVPAAAFHLVAFSLAA